MRSIALCALAACICCVMASEAVAEENASRPISLRSASLATSLLDGLRSNKPNMRLADVTCSKSCSVTSCSRTCTGSQQCVTYCSGDGKDAYCECK
jgi:hypothetical protein